MKRSKSIIALSIVDIICSLAHFAFQGQLGDNQGRFREFLLMENVLVAVILVYICIMILSSNNTIKKEGLRANLIIWITICTIIVIYQPNVTTLDNIKGLLVLPQKYYLMAFGLTAIALASYSYYKMDHNEVAKK